MFVSIKLPNGRKVEQTIHKHSLSIGRSNKCDVIVPDESLSRHHAQLEIIDGNFFVTDLGSANGVFIGGERIEPNVKTRFTSFVQLSIGPLECTVLDLEDSQEQSNSSPSKSLKLESGISQRSNHDQTATKKIYHERSTPPPREPRSAKSESKGVSPKIMGIGILLGLGAVFYYQSSGEQKASELSNSANGSATSTKVAVPAKKRPPMIPDEFATPAGYLEKMGGRTCQGFAETCRDLELDSDGEGVAMEDKEIFIFLNPLPFLELPHFAKIREIPTASDILAIYYILKSQTLLELQRGNYTQIHLIIINNDKVPQKVYRFHPKSFDPDGNKKSFLLDRISNSIKNEAMDEFWKESSSLIPSKPMGNL